MKRDNAGMEVLPVLLLGFLACLAFLPGEAADTGRCFDEGKATDEMLVIDANTGEVISGSTSRERNAPVKVVITRKNPFKYKYAYSVDVQVIQESATISSMLQLIAPLGAVPDLVNPAAADAVTKSIGDMAVPKPSPPSAKGVTTADLCPEAELATLLGLSEDFKQKKARAAELGTKLKDATTKFNETQKAYNDFKTLTDNDRLDCAAAEAAATPTGTALQSFQMGTLAKDSAQLAAEVTKLKEVASYFKFTAQACADKRAGLVEQIELLRQSATAQSEAVAKMEKGAEAFAAMNSLIAEARATDPYFESHEIGAQRKPSTATINVSRTPRANKDQQSTSSVVVELGQPFMSLSVGGGVSTIGEVKYGREASLVPDGSGGEVLGERFAVTDEADPAPLGAVLLHANLWQWGKRGNTTGALSLGVTIGDDDSAATFGYLFGMSFGFLERSFYVTVGYHLRDVKSLGGGFKEGDVVPSELEAIPIRREGADGAMIVFSYRVK